MSNKNRFQLQKLHLANGLSDSKSKTHASIIYLHIFLQFFG